MTLVYHLMPRQLVGHTLYPLNQLKEIAPEAFAQHRQKYKEREALSGRTIPLLDCLWNDVLFFSPVHPIQIRDGFIAAGSNWKPQKWCIIDSLTTGFDQHNTAIYYSQMNRKKGDFQLPPPDTFGIFTLEKLAAMRDIPTQTLNYYREAVVQGEPIFPWRGIPHILYRGHIALDDAVIIEV